MLKLEQTDWSQFDLALESQADDLDNTALQTLIYATLFTDQVAPAGRVADPFDQRGWWHDPSKGTGLWYVRRQGLSESARQEALGMVKQALESKNATLTNINISDITSDGNVSSLILSISGEHNGRKFTTSIGL